MLQTKYQSSISIENKFSSIQNTKIFNLDEVVEQMKRCRSLLTKEMDIQFKQLKSLYLHGNNIADISEVPVILM